ncbi:MAG: hypothetical protein OXG16_02305 [Rhodospirillales bacterium]|nr:hypothetical protein [Rhodospirillales bacterium]MCY3701498.1 hypothetical protein [Rhodospirillales bacterium]
MTKAFDDLPIACDTVEEYEAVSDAAPHLTTDELCECIVRYFQRPPLGRPHDPEPFTDDDKPKLVTELQTYCTIYIHDLNGEEFA